VYLYVILWNRPVTGGFEDWHQLEVFTFGADLRGWATADGLSTG